MEDVKWLKLDPNFLDGSSFKFMRRAKIDGVADLRDKLEAVWFELIGLAGKVNNQGMFYNDEIAYNSFEDIAIMLDRSTEEVQICMDFYIKHKMVTIIDDFILLTNWDKFQNVKGLEELREKRRLRTRKCREKQKALLENKKDVEAKSCNVTCNAVVTLPSQETKDLDLDLDLDLEKENITTKECGLKGTEFLDQNIPIEKNPSLNSTEKNTKKYSSKNFDRFWKAYPKKVGKPKCESWFKSHKITTELTDIIIKSIEEHLKTEQWKDQMFIPYPYKYLSEKRFEDVLAEEDYVIGLAPKIKTAKEIARDKRDAEIIANTDFSTIFDEMMKGE